MRTGSAPSAAADDDGAGPLASALARRLVMSRNEPKVIV
jgi:hypothetical protein